jgi:hypothetical protein
MKLILTSKRIGGRVATEYLDERSGRSVVRLGAWRRQREVGGAPFPRFGPSQIATLAAAMIEARVTGGEPPMVPRDMPPADVGAAARIVETLLD